MEVSSFPSNGGDEQLIVGLPTLQLPTMFISALRNHGWHRWGFSSLAYQLFNETSLQSTKSLMDPMPQRNPSFNSIIIELVKCGELAKALNVFRLINDGFGLKPTKVMLCSVLNSCSKSQDLRLGSQIHALVIRMGYKDNIFLASAIVDLYSKCEELKEAKRVFSEMREHDAVSWTSIIVGFSQNGHGEEALIFFKEMLKAKVSPNCFTFTSVISACKELDIAYEPAKLLHAQAIKRGELNNFVVSSLIDYYMKRGENFQAILLFDAAVVKDIVLYNAMIAGFSQNLIGEDAWKLFLQMRDHGISPTHITVSSLLNACGSLVVLQQGRQLHALIFKIASNQNIIVVSSLVDMYSKCGVINEAERAFDLAVEKNSIILTSMLTGYAQNGRGIDGVNLFEQLVQAGMRPDHICFTSVLTACVHGGYVDKGIYYFNMMESKYGLTPGLDQYACMIDLYGRTGHLKMAKELMDHMPFKPNAVMWSSFLGSCRTYGEIQLGEEAASNLFVRHSQDMAPYVALANTYAEVGMWKGVAELRKMMRYNGVKKRAGCSWVEANNESHVFTARDSSHPQSKEIYSALDALILEMRKNECDPKLADVL